MVLLAVSKNLKPRELRKCCHTKNKCPYRQILLDKPPPKRHRGIVRYSIYFLVAALTLSSTIASTIRFEGTPGWRISNSQATVTFNGITNNRPSNSISGTLKVVLWASARPFPSRGYRVAEFRLGELRGGQRFAYYTTPSRPARVPKVTGPMHFTVVLEEYNGGYRRVDFKPTGIKRLRNGRFVQAPAWRVPTQKRVIAPKRVLRVGDRLELTMRAVQGTNLIPVGSVIRTTAVIRGQGQGVATSPVKTSPFIYSYRVAAGTFGGKRVQTGNLFMDYARAINANIRSSSNVQLFFHTPATGTYNSFEVDPAGGGRVWGDFRFF